MKSLTFRQSRELIDNKLNASTEYIESKIYDLDGVVNFEDNKPIIQGLVLDQSEDRVLHTLSLLLYRKSENRNQKSPNYCMGNYEKGVVSINQIEMETARILVSPHEFYSTYYGRDDYNSDHIKFILEKLDSLSKRAFLTAWRFPKEGNRKSKKTYLLFRTYLQLFQMTLVNEDLSKIECDEILNADLLEGRRCKFLFKFQPQFTNNIKDQYVEFPEDIYFRIASAIGKDRFSSCINLMRDFLFREKQQKRYEIVRDKDTLIHILKLDNLKKEGRKKIMNDKIQECINVFLKIGLLKQCIEVTGSLGQAQYRILINEEFK